MVRSFGISWMSRSAQCVCEWEGSWDRSLSLGWLLNVNPMCMCFWENSTSVCWTRIISSTDGELVCLCDSPTCLEVTRCQGTRCFSSVQVRSSGVVFEHGCLKGQQKIRLHCATAPSFQQAIFCCSEHMCNGNTTRSSLMSLLPSGTWIVAH